ncbi:MAG: type II toxin-antitoxin system VapC family toxin [Spirulina sp. SIO3F2]|nr:type II toxin-antitoxin system VapC family toxin [Spirulina sp. SIO3F2]
MELRPILLDTNAYTALTRNVTDAVEMIKYVPSVHFNSVILGELLAGFATGSKESDNKAKLNYFLEIDKVKCLPIDPVTSEFYALVYRDLRQKGRPIPTNDMWIAATALQYNLALFSYDRHFQVVEGLVVGSCIADFSA